jgi:hypothetical protein
MQLFLADSAPMLITTWNQSHQPSHRIDDVNAARQEQRLGVGIHRQQWLGVFEVSCEKVATVEQCCIVDDSSGC